MRSAPPASLAGLALVMALGVGVGLLGIFRPVGVFDEAFVLVGAERVVHGELPLSDFYTPYPPGQYLAVALLFKVFGVDALTLRVYCVVVRAAVALLVCLLATSLAGRALAAACWCASILWLTAVGSFGYPTIPSLALVLLGLWMLSNAWNVRARGGRSSATRVAGAGAVLGVAMLFRHDLGLYGLVASLPLLAVGTAQPHGAAGRGRASALWPFMAGFAAALGIPAVWLLSSVPVQFVTFEMLTYPATGYARMRGLPYPPLLHSQWLVPRPSKVPFYAPFVFDAAALVWIAVRAIRLRTTLIAVRDARLASLALLGLTAFNLTRVRPDEVHVVAAVIPSFVVAASLIQRAWATTRPAWRAAAIGIAGVSALMLVPPIRSFPRPVPSVVRSVLGGAADPGRVSHLATGPEHRAVAGFLRSVVPPGGRVFVGCGRHDKVFINQPLVYFLAGRLPGGRYHMFDPGIVTTLAVQQEMVRGLVRHRVEYLVISSGCDWRAEPNQSAISSGVTYLDDYLRRNYALVQRFGDELSVWRRAAAWDVPTGGA